MKLQAQNLTKDFHPHSNIVRSLSAHLFEKFRGEKNYRHVVFQNIDLEVGDGECLAILGNNGSGKSTLLRCLGGITARSQGSIKIHGRMIALLSHGFGPYEELAVGSNIVLVQQLLGLPAKAAKANVTAIAKTAGLESRVLSPTSQLSEGMRAKLSLCCLPFVPFDLLLLDESLNHVDEDFRNFFLDLTRKWISEGRSILLTSHERALVEKFATRKLLLQDKALISLA